MNLAKERNIKPLVDNRLVPLATIFFGEFRRYAAGLKLLFVKFSRAPGYMREMFFEHKFVLTDKASSIDDCKWDIKASIKSSPFGFVLKP